MRVITITNKTLTDWDGLTEDIREVTATIDGVDSGVVLSGPSSASDEGCEDAMNDKLDELGL